MSHECSKAAMRRQHDPSFAACYLVGDALDIGAGPDGLSKQRWLWRGLTSVKDWDKPDGDAQTLPGVLPNRYDCVHSSHCLEHMVDARAALQRWFQVLRPNGYLITLVPDEDLYEQGVWPSTFNTDHRWTFTTWKATSWSPVSLNVLELVPLLGERADLVKVERLHRTWAPEPAGRWDRTGGMIGEAAIEFIVRKRP